MAQNHQKWPKRFYKAQNGPWGHKTVLRDIIHDYMSCWPTLGPFRDPRGPQKGPKQLWNLLKWPKITRSGQNGYKAQNGPWGHKTVLRDIIHDYMSCWPTLGPFRDPKGVPKTALKPIWGPKTPLKGPRRAKIGTNASHAVQLTTLGPKNQILTVSATFGDFGSF